ncbi:hypothetical protein DFH29DRAFT_1038013 [Suillus ampliporus]|nr:hypothetical protein DFH29DRAFT_1038013 [Suillus ampliporus]
MHSNSLVGAQIVGAISKLKQDKLNIGIQPILQSQRMTPYRNHIEFETAEFFFAENQTPAAQVNKLLDLWASTLKKHDDKPPFADYHDLYKTINKTPLGDIKWESFSVRYNGKRPDTDVPPWMDQVFEVWYCDPQEDIISEDPESHGSTFVPVVLGSDKTTVSVATGNNEYYPLYASIGNVCNNVRRAHHDAVSIIAFLTIPKMTKEHATGDVKFRKFCQQLFHCSLSKILETLRPGITKYEVACFSDRHFCHVIYGLGPYIADYEEQVLLTCIVCGWCLRCLSSCINLDEPADWHCCHHMDVLVEEGTLDALWDEYGIVGDLVPFTNDFAWADIHELIAPDILHQLIKGTFKDHLVDWIEKIAAVPTFAGFKQWMGDDSKALMKVYLSAIEGVITEKTLKQIQEALDQFHRYQKIFETLNHSLQHYILLIQLFGAPNGLCSSITEAKHIKAVKEPWRHSSQYKALGQMLVTNQHLNKLAALHADFTQCKMLDGTCLSAAALEAVNTTVDNNDNNDNEVNDGPTDVEAHVELAKMPHESSSTSLKLSILHLPNLLRCFLFSQLNPDDPHDPSEVPLACCPQFDNKINVFNSACSRFFALPSSKKTAPSDLSGISSMCHEYIHACPIWRNKHPQFDCVFVNTNPGLDSMRGMDVAQVLSFFSFTYKAKLYPCAVMWWFDTIGDLPNEDTGMWVVQPAHNANNMPHISIIHIDSIYHAAHLIPVYGTQLVPPQHQHYQTYDFFCHFYVNKYADHYSFEIAF